MDGRPRRLGVCGAPGVADSTLRQAREKALVGAATPPDDVSVNGAAQVTVNNAFTSDTLTLTNAGAVDINAALNHETEATIAGFLDPETTERLKDFG